MDNSSSHVESCWRTQLRNRIIQASSLLEILLSGLVLIGLLLSAVPLIKWMPGLLFDGNDVEVSTFLQRALDIVIGIEFIKMLAKHSPGSSLEVLLYAIARHLVVGHDSAVENLLSVGAIALIFIVRKFFFVPAFGAQLKKLLRTDVDTGTAGNAFVCIDNRQAGFFGNTERTKLTGTDTIAEADTAGRAFTLRSSNAGGHAAAFQADVFKFCRRVFARAVAAQNRDQSLMLRHFIAQQSSDFLHDGFAADRTIQPGKAFTVSPNAGGGKIMTSRFTAGAAVYAGQTGFDLADQRVFNNGKFAGNGI